MIRTETRNNVTVYNGPGPKHPDGFIGVYRPTKLAALRALAAATRALDEVE